jgi:hypothetical protein
MLATTLPSRSSLVRAVLAPALCAGVALAQVAGPRPVQGGTSPGTNTSPGTTSPATKATDPQQPASSRFTYEPVHNRYMRLDAFDRYGKRHKWNPLTMSDGTGEYPILRGAPLFDVYNTNKWKGDEPILGENTFLAAQLVSNNLFESRDKVQADSAVELRSTEFLTVDFFHGDTVFRPPTWRVRATLAADFRDADDVGGGKTQTDAAFQELFGEVLLWESDPYLDFGSLRLGRQAFASDFRNFIFVDNNDGVQLFGTLNESKVDWQLAFFDMASKDPFSNFNDGIGDRDQTFWAANVFFEDLLATGYKVELSLQGVHDTAGFNDQTLGQIDRTVDAYYLGFNGEGRIGKLEVAHAFYWMTGKDDLNQFSARQTDISAQMAAIEVAVPWDWRRYVFSALYASGDSNPTDNKGGGFDSVTDNPNFAGGAFGFFDRQGINTNTADNPVGLVDAGGNNRALVNTNSFYPNLRTKANEAPNSVNPGLFILHAGCEATLSNYWNVAVNASYLMFANTAVLEQASGLNSVGNGIGFDFSVAGQYRPLGVDNVIITPGIQVLVPTDGFKDLSNEDALFAVFINAVIVL